MSFYRTLRTALPENDKLSSYLVQQKIQNCQNPLSAQKKGGEKVYAIN